MERIAPLAYKQFDLTKGRAKVKDKNRNMKSRERIDTPVENIIALYDEAHRYGKIP